jgi:hypothetical protein
VWSIFAALKRTLSRGRSVPTPHAAESAFSFEANWAPLLANLKLPPHAIREVVTSGSLGPHFRYHRFHKPKKNGKPREISEPDARLKRIQHEIIARYFASEQIHPAAVAYQRGKSTADHIWMHAGSEVIVVADIQDFFPNTRAARIEDWWRARVDSDTARLLTLLTTDRGGLPQGAPTSPGLSNFVNRELDTTLAHRAGIAGARYTRYCDDLAFSWPVGSGPPSGFEPGVRAALHEFGYVLHPTKGWRVYDRRDEPEITGAVLTRSGGVRLPDRIRKIMWKLAVSENPHASQRLGGYEGYEEMVTQSPERRRKKKQKKEKARAKAKKSPARSVPPLDATGAIAPAPTPARYIESPPQPRDEPPPYSEPDSEPHGDEDIPF